MTESPAMEPKPLASDRRRVARVALALLVVMLLDQLSKYWLLSVVEMDARPPIVLTSFFRLVMVWNKGVSFGMFSDMHAVMPYVLMAVALIISAVLWRLAMKTTHRGEQIAYGMVIGGALGNCIDRARFGAVADFFHFHLGSFSYPAFNVADSAICIGVGLLLLFAFKYPARS